MKKYHGFLPQPLCFALVCSLVFWTVSSQDVIRLQPWRINKDKITLSGFSSGGTFAQQLQFSYSNLFSGIAVFSHTYYRCGPGNGIQKDYDDVCTKLGNLNESQLYDPENALNDINRYYKEKLIENPDNLRHKRLYVFAGLRSFLFSLEMSLRIIRIYQPFIRNPEMITTRVMDAELLLPSSSNRFGNCTSRADKTSFVGSCGLSGPLDSLRFLLFPEFVKRPGNVKLEPLRQFDQSEYFIPERHDMDKIGFVYVPKNCQPNRNSYDEHERGFPGFGGGHRKPLCNLHFYFHGCFTGRIFEGPNHIMNSGFLEVAEANNIIVVFPQSVNSTGNEIGCWDTYGFTGRDYATQRGAQVQVVHKMISRILGQDIQFPPGNNRQPVPPPVGKRNQNGGTFPKSRNPTREELEYFF